jgi:hypothetical protein
MKFGSTNQSLPSRSQRLEREPPLDAPRVEDVLFEIGVILAVHLGIALAVFLLLRDCTSC